MIGLSTLAYDLDGFLLIRENIKTQNPTLERRVTRTATLDGLSSISDLGYSDSDGTFFLSITNITQTGIDTLEYLVKNYANLRLSAKSGCFEGVLKLVDTNTFPIQATFLINKRVS